MKVISLQIAKKKEILFNNKMEETGFFKNLYKEQLTLNKEGVLGDFVADKVHHGGLDKASYLFGYNHYSYWQKKYPELAFKYGQFGENITLDSINENDILIGDEYTLGEVLLQITQPRQPCYKLGIAFNNQKIVNEFRDYFSPGLYIRILKEGKVKKGDQMILSNRLENSPSVLEVYSLLYSKSPDENLMTRVLSHESIASNVKTYLQRKWKNY
ncbi:MAG: MOSC domain-containing protein [Flavobacteriia bacterium]|nr:MOSC domain-containing protein [Flavobacteriia bacterium]